MTPKFATIENWAGLSGISRTKTYYLIAQGHLRAVKVDGRTLVDVEAGLAWLNAQPAAAITCKRFARSVAA